MNIRQNRRDADGTWSEILARVIYYFDIIVIRGLNLITVRHYHRSDVLLQLVPT